MTAQLDIYFPTTDLNDQELAERKIKAGSQNAIILDIFRGNPHWLLTPFDVQKCWNRKFKEIPITSIRRSITTLTMLGYLLKTSDFRRGDYGEKNHL